MPKRFGRFFLLIFIWLQCLAPLLHAHAGEPGHFGLHLPGYVGVGSSGIDAAAGYADHHTQPTLCVNNGIMGGQWIGQLRTDSAMPALAPAWATRPMTSDVNWSATPHLDPPPLKSSRQQPLPGAPPPV